MNKKVGTFIYAILGVYIFIIGFFVPMEVKEKLDTELPEKLSFVFNLRGGYMSGVSDTAASASVLGALPTRFIFPK